MAMNRQSEIYSLLANERDSHGALTKTAEVAEYMSHGIGKEEMQLRMGNSTPPDNRIAFVEYLIRGGRPSAQWIAKGVLPTISRWLNDDLASHELRLELMDDERHCSTALGKAPLLRAPHSDGTDTGTKAPPPRSFDDHPNVLPENTDSDALAKGRREQKRLRDCLLRGRSKAQCELCSRVMGAQLLVAAHIVPRRDLDHQERTQFGRIAMLACQLGCDRLFELGYLTVGEDGLIRSASDGVTPPDAFEHLEGRHCLAHNELTAEAFREHQSRFA